MAEETIEILASGDDAIAYAVSTSYPPGAGTGTDDVTTTGTSERSRYAADDWAVSNTLLRFSTGTPIPDGATITAAVLRLRGTAKNDSADALSITWEWYTFDGTVDNSDWTNTPATTAHAGRTIASLGTTGDEDFTLLNPDANITKVDGAYTGLRSHCTAPGTPAGINYWRYASFDNVSLDPPRLIITYALPGRNYHRFYGPAQLGSSPATLYTVPENARAVIRNIYANNPSGSPVNITLSIGTDEDATHIFDADPVPAGGSLFARRETNYVLEAGEVLQGFASSAATVVLTVNGVEYGL